MESAFAPLKSKNRQPDHDAIEGTAAANNGFYILVSVADTTKSPLFENH